MIGYMVMNLIRSRSLSVHQSKFQNGAFIRNYCKPSIGTVIETLRQKPRKPHLDIKYTNCTSEKGAFTIDLKKIRDFNKKTKEFKSCKPLSDLIQQRSFTSCGGTNRPTVGEALKEWTKELNNAGVTEAKSSVEFIVAHTLGCKMLHELGSSGKIRKLTEDESQRIEKMCLQRIERVPLQYIIGEWDFLDLTLKMQPPVFIPRPETEMFVSNITQHYDPDIPHQFLELCCGSGCITCSLLKELPKLNMVAIDCLKEAVDLTKENAKRYDVDGRLEVFQEKVGPDVPLCLHRRAQKFDAIISNPPYVFTKHLDDLAPEIFEHEDMVAFDGGADGTNIIKDIIRLAPKLLKPDGYIWLEVDFRHPDMIHYWLISQTDLPVKYVRTDIDFTARPRYVLLQYKQ